MNNLEPFLYKEESMKELHLNNVEFSEIDSLIGGICSPISFKRIEHLNDKYISVPSGTTYEMAVTHNGQELNKDEMKGIINEINAANICLVAGSKDNYDVLYLIRK